MAVALTLTACGSDGEDSGDTTPTTVAKADLWGLPEDPSINAALAGLPMLGTEMLAVHYHAHVDVIIDGTPKTVAANIGIDQADQRLSPLHTHDTRGVVHIESASNGTFTLGQFFTEWGVPLSADTIGDQKNGNGKTLRVYVNGTQTTDDPNNIVFKPHMQIALVFGAEGVPAQIPSSYQFNQGE